MAEAILARRYSPALRLGDQPHELVHLDGGQCYRMTVRCHASRHFGKAIFVLADGREVAYVRIPYLPGRRRLALAAVFRLRPMRREEVRLSLQAEQLPPALGASQVWIDEIRIEPFEPTAVPRQARRGDDVPEPPLLAAWGFRIASYYQRKDPGAGPDELFDQAVRWFRRLGGNLFPHLIYKKVALDAPIHGVGSTMAYPVPWQAYGVDTACGFMDDARWLNDGFGDLAGRIHQVGGRVWPAAVFAPADLVQPYEKHRVAQAVIAHLLDALAAEPDRLYDAFEGELYFRGPQDLRRVSDLLEAYCPGACLIDYHLRPSARPPNFISASQAAHGWGTVRIFGVDDHDPARIALADGRGVYEPPLYGDFRRLPARALEDDYGSRFIAGEVDLRDVVPSGDSYGGGCEDDWIIKQINDLVRADLLGGTRSVAGAFLFGSLDWTSRERFLTAAAAAADPIRGALAGQLKATGAGGVFEQKRHAAGIDGPAWTEAASRRRYDSPAETWFVRNNFLCLYAGGDPSVAELWCDPQASGHFDNDSLAERVAAGLFDVDSRWRWRRREIGPVLAAIEAIALHGRVEMRIEMHADSPYLFIHGRGAGLLRLGRLEQADLASGIAVFSDSRNRIARRFVMAIGETRLTVKREGDASELSVSGTKRDRWTAVVGLPQFLPGVELTALKQGLEDSSRLEDPPCPVIRAVRLTNQPDGPVWVREGRWWVARAAQISLRDSEKAWVKVYAQPGRCPGISTSRYLLDCIAAGPGWDYLLAFDAVQRRRACIEAVVAVLGCNPLVGPPEVRLCEKVALAWVNDRPWQRYDGDRVWLPIKAGQYRIRIKPGACSMPTVTRSSADFSRCFWDETSKRLSLTVQDPPWCRKRPAWYRYTAVIECRAWRVAGAIGAKLLRSNDRRAIVRFDRQNVILRFVKPDR